MADYLDLSAGLDADRSGAGDQRLQRCSAAAAELLPNPQIGKYRENQVLTASREQLVVLTYDGILRFLGRACRGLEAGDYHEKHLGLARAQALIMDLARSLDRAASPELAANLSAVYAYWLDELATADAGDDQPRIQAIMALVAELREAWAEVARRATP